MDIGDAENYGEDMGVLWAAHQAGGIPQIPIDSSQEEFAEVILGWLSAFQAAFIIEDNTSAFSSGRGAVALVVVGNDGEIIKPFGIFFAWATTRNILRCVTGFLQYAKYSSDVVLCVIYGTLEENEILQRQRRYGHNLWHVGNGIWCISGRRKNPRS